MESLLENLANRGIQVVPASSLPKKQDPESSFRYYSEVKEPVVMDRIYRSGNLFLFPSYSGTNYEQARCRIRLGGDIIGHVKQKIFEESKESKDFDEALSILNKGQRFVNRLNNYAGVHWTEDPAKIADPGYMRETAEKLISVFMPHMFEDLRSIYRLGLKPKVGEPDCRTVPVIYNISSN